MITYEDFAQKLNAKIKTDNNCYYELLETVINNPERYTGIFRLSNAKTKLIQNVTQSREIKFGDFMEEIVTDYIADMGYENFDKSIGTDEEGNDLSADQVFCDDNTVYLIEQKIRDDHDSTKKRGQYDNFKKKYTLLKNMYPEKRIDATMWFIDNTLVKNRKYYLENAESETLDVNIHILYGGDLFDVVFSRSDVWEEIKAYLYRNKMERTSEILTIPDFDTSEEMLDALARLKDEKYSLFAKLTSNKPKYVQLRKELFPTEMNIKKLIEN